MRKATAVLAVVAALAACGSDDEPTADEPTADESTADESTADEPTAAEPTAEEPTADEPTAEEPALEPDSDKDQETFSVLNSSTSTVPPGLEALAAGACAAENEALPLEISQIPSADLQQRIGLLASQDALPTMFSASDSLITPGGDLEAAGLVLDVAAALDEMGLLDRVNNGVRSVYEKLYEGTMPSLPFQYNIEGIWYNKAIFADLGIEEPQTWDELLAAAEAIKATGVAPFTAAADPAWTITRWIGAHQFRAIGPDALLAVKNGEAKLTDPEYVASIQAIQDLNTAGYFVDGISGYDYDTSANAFLTGQAAMIYMGTWFLGNVNDPEQNQLGEDGVGFMPFPAVEGGGGDINAYPANAGAPNVINPNHWGPKAQAWVKCIVENWPQMAMTEFGAFSGFISDAPLEGIPAISIDVQEKMASAPSAVLWNEALMNVAGGDAAKNFAPQLLTGGISAEDYAIEVQDALDNGGA